MVVDEQSHTSAVYSQLLPVFRLKARTSADGHEEGVQPARDPGGVQFLSSSVQSLALHYGKLTRGRQPPHAGCAQPLPPPPSRRVRLSVCPQVTPITGSSHEALRALLRMSGWQYQTTGVTFVTTIN
jgi:hypothetical protein